MLFGLRMKVNAMRKARAKEEAKLYGIEEKKFDKYYDTNRKRIYIEKEKAKNKAMIESVRKNPDSPTRGAMKEVGKYLKERRKEREKSEGGMSKKGIRREPWSPLGGSSFDPMGGGSGGPQFDMDKKKKRDLW